MILGLTLALGSALGTNLGFLFKQRGAVLARPIRLRHPAHSAVDLFRSRWFVVGWIISLLAWVLHVESLSLAALKYLTHAHGPLLGLLSPWTLTALISFVVCFYASARILQIGLAIEVIAITSVAANLAAIIGGILVFGEPIGSGALGITARVLAFCFVIAGAALVPAPLRAHLGSA